NYQTIMAPLAGEHVAYGDTGVVIYCNSVCGARSNFEGGPSALAAALTARTPRYGYHLDERRRSTLLVEIDFAPRELNEWGALGAGDRQCRRGRVLGSAVEPDRDGAGGGPDRGTPRAHPASRRHQPAG